MVRTILVIIIMIVSTVAWRRKTLMRKKETIIYTTSSHVACKKKESASGAAKIDPLSFVLLITPLTIPLLLCGLLFLPAVGTTAYSEMPARVAQFYPELFLNSLCAFCLNLTIACFLREGSALAFIICGNCKDVLLVGLSFAFFKEDVSLLGKFLG